MKKNLLIILPIIGVLISGCTNQPSNDEDYLIKYNNLNHVVGDKNNYIKKITYMQNDDKRIVFYVDKFPYEKEFNLCDKNDLMLKAKNINKNLVYTANKEIKCKGFISIDRTNLKNPYWTTFNFDFLNNAHYNKEIKSFVEDGIKVEVVNTFLHDGLNENIYTFQSQKGSFLLE